MRPWHVALVVQIAGVVGVGVGVAALTDTEALSFGGLLVFAAAGYVRERVSPEKRPKSRYEAEERELEDELRHHPIEPPAKP